METAGLAPAIVVDCSHANSNKDYNRQPAVAQDVCMQLGKARSPIRGVMIESHLKAGNQKVLAGQPLMYGQSITDGCISWETTESVLEQLAEAVLARMDREDD
jgi:3-deoxy-7-phosphoheptulonate synthase